MSADGNRRVDGDTIEGLRQYLWDVYAALGFDTGGDRTPAAVVNLGETVLKAAREFRADYDETLDQFLFGCEQVGWKMCDSAAAPGDLYRLDDERHAGKCPDCIPVFARTPKEDGAP